MQADYSTEIEVSGSSEDLKKVIYILKKIEVKDFDAYLLRIKLKTNDHTARLEELKEESDIDAFLAKSNGTLNVDAAGPWGHFSTLADAKIFETIAEAAPAVSMTGKTEGMTTYTEESIEAKLTDGILHLRSDFEANEEVSDEYYSSLKEAMPYERFIKVFKIDEEEFEEDDYEEYLSDSDGYDCFMRQDYDEFMACCEASGISEAEYESLKEQLSYNSPELDWEHFNEFYEGGTVEEYDYDPVKKEYLDPVRNDPLNQPGIVSITPENLEISQEEYDRMTMDEVFAAIKKRLGV